MAVEDKSEDQMEDKNDENREQESEPSKDVGEQGTETDNTKDGVMGSEIKDVEKIKEKQNEADTESGTSANGLERSSSFGKESSHLSNLRQHEAKALSELKSKIEDAILGKKFFSKKNEQGNEMSAEKDGKQNEKEKTKQLEEGSCSSSSGEGKENETLHKLEAREKAMAAVEGKGKEIIIDEQDEKQDVGSITLADNQKGGGNVDKDLALWGVPLLPSKGDRRTDVILMKFLRAREFKVNESFEMLRSTIQWRKENRIDSIMDENFRAELGTAAYMEGNDRDGHPVCYNIFGVLGNDELHDRILEKETKHEKVVRWRIQLMEKGVNSLDFNPGSVSAMLQINDLKSTPLPTKKELRLATRKAVELFQDNYPEFVAKNVFINVPFWYYAFSALLSPFLTQRTKNKFIYARASKVTETLLKYISGDQIPVRYGGLRRENDLDFSVKDAAAEVFIKGGSTESIEIPSPEAGNTLIWDLNVCGWEVNYREEFVPTNEGSYTIIVQKGRKISWQEGSIRNTFKNNEPGKVVITIENGAFKKKRVLYRYKIKSLS